MKRLFCLIMIVLLLQAAGYAQHNPLLIQGSGGKFFLLHKVEARENWYSLGRLYNLTPRDIAAYNGTEIAKPLELGQSLNIPLTNANFDQKKIPAEGEALVPVYHVVQDREWAFRLSSLYNDVPVTSLEKWNNIKRDQVKQGMPLVVGYLKIKTDQSPLGAEAPVAPPTGNAVPAKPAAQTSLAATDKPATGKPDATVTSPATPEKPATGTNPAAESGTKSTVVNAPATPVPVGGAGFFQPEFTGKWNKTQSGQAGTFKSTSGWTDGKYYALMNEVPVGTIVKVSGNGKTVFAKVLGQLPEMKESGGLLLRVSNAAAGQLGVASGESRLSVDVVY